MVRNRLHSLALIVALITACGAPPATPSPIAPGVIINLNSAGKRLPPDAAPNEQQVITWPSGSTPGSRFMDVMAMSYNTAMGSGLFSIPLTRVNKDYEIIPGAASSWSASPDGKTWTFKLRADLNWSDGTPVTADDWIASFRHIADKQTGYDFGWYFDEMAIKNFAEAEAGSARLEDIGMRAGASPKDLVIETTRPIPYMPSLVIYAAPLQKRALEKYGATYNSDPKTSVSDGPFVLEEWSEKRVVVRANKTQPDDLKPYLDRVIFTGGTGNTMLFDYQAGVLDFAIAQGAADVKVIFSDPKLSPDAATNINDFQTYYFFFDNSKPPFDNVKVRQAFAHLFDRETIVRKVLPPPAAIPLSGMLAPGFPSSNQEALKPLQAYDPALAKKLYAESGVTIAAPLILQIRMRGAQNEAMVVMAQVYADELMKQLGVQVEVRRSDENVFMEALNAKPTEIQFGMAAYGMDFLDPINMLSVFKTGGRHNWNSAAYTGLLAQAGPEQDKSKRDLLFKDAERLLVTEAPAVFAFQEFYIELWRPFLAGPNMRPGRVNKARGLGFLGNTALAAGLYDTYVTQEVTKTRPVPPK